MPANAGQCVNSIVLLSRAANWLPAVALRQKDGRKAAQLAHKLALQSATRPKINRFALEETKPTSEMGAQKGKRRQNCCIQSGLKWRSSRGLSIARELCQIGRRKCLEDVPALSLGGAQKAIRRHLSAVQAVLPLARVCACAECRTRKAGE